jgi:hypothetical protein
MTEIAPAVIACDKRKAFAQGARDKIAKHFALKRRSNPDFPAAGWIASLRSQ